MSDAKVTLDAGAVGAAAAGLKKTTTVVKGSLPTKE